MSDMQAAVRVEGSGNFTAGRDLLVTNQEIREIEFKDLSLDDYGPPHFPIPQQITQLVAVLQDCHLLVLGSPRQRDTSDLARQVAWHLSRAQALTQGMPPAPSACEAWSNQEPRKLLVRLRQTSQPTIFVLPDIAPPSMVAEDLDQIRQALHLRGHFVIITTSSPRAEWLLGEQQAAPFWHHVVEDQLYSAKGLAEWLAAQLAARPDDFPPGCAGPAASPDQPFDQRLTPRLVVARLRTFPRLRSFLLGLRTIRQPVSDDLLEQLLADVISASELPLDTRYRRWYRAQSERVQLLALNLSFFGGMFENQFFAAFEQLFHTVWRSRDPQLRAFDYDDLAATAEYVDLVPTRSEMRVVEPRLPELRQIMLCEAWPLHRRQVQAALPELVRIIQRSVTRQPLHTELYSNDGRRLRLRNTLGETLSLLGLIDPAVLQPTLLELAADDRITVQFVGANVLAHWRSYGQHNLLFETLREWHDSEDLRHHMQAVLRGLHRDSEGQPAQPGSIRAPKDYLCGMVALAVAVAARYDPPNRLAPELLTFFRRLGTEQSPFVQQRFLKFTMPLVLERHLLQLRDELREMTRHEHLREPIVAALELAYQSLPNDVMATLDQWHSHGATSQVSGNAQRPPNPKETLLVTVALAYGEIANDANFGPLTFDVAFDQLGKILAGAQISFVRAQTVNAFGRLAKRAFGRIEPLLRDAVRHLSLLELQPLIESLRDIHVVQRQALNDPVQHATLRHVILPENHPVLAAFDDDTDEKRSFPIWLWPGRRPLTEVERTMFAWLRDANNPVAQQIAVLVMEQISHVLEHELNRRAFEMYLAGLSQPGETVIVTAEHKPGLYERRLVPWLATLGSGPNRRTIRNVLPNVVSLQRQRPDIGLVLEQWRTIDDRDIQVISGRLLRALWLLALLKTPAKPTTPPAPAGPTVLAQAQPATRKQQRSALGAGQIILLIVMACVMLQLCAPR